MASLHSLRTMCTSEWQTPQNRISISTSRSVRSRRGIVIEASGDVALVAENALARFISLIPFWFRLSNPSVGARFRWPLEKVMVAVSEAGQLQDLAAAETGPNLSPTGTVK